MRDVHYPRWWLFVLSIHLTLLTNAQNLVPNPGFEEYTVCPGNYAQHKAEFRAKGWISAGNGTPDHFHSCSAGDAGVPHNWAGVAEAYEGRGYAGIYTWMNSDNNFREYLQCTLAETLIRDSTYIIEFHYRLSSYSMYATNRIGVLMEDSMISVAHDQYLLRAPHLEVREDSALTQRTGLWETARFEFRAKGGERFLILGNFGDNKSTLHYKLRFQPVQQPMLAKSAYYYIDEVKVVPRYMTKDLLADVIPAFHPEDVEVNKDYVLQNINFEFNSYKLQSSSKDELNELVLYLSKNPGIKVRLSGHTDDVGGERYNLLLSKNRAGSVAAYLIAQGIAANRVESSGYGKSRPLIASQSEEARRLNRRVEVRFLN